MKIHFKVQKKTKWIYIINMKNTDMFPNMCTLNKLCFHMYFPFSEFKTLTLDMSMFRYRNKDYATYCQPNKIAFPHL